jgi:hypothetical protein
MVSYTKPKLGSTGKTKKQLGEDKTHRSGRSLAVLPHHAAQFHDQSIKLNMNRAKPVLRAFPREYDP